MNAADCKPGVERLIPSNIKVVNETPARFILELPFLCPGIRAAQVTCPILFAICGRDTVAPPGPSLAYAKQAPKSTIRLYRDMGHFDIYVDHHFEVAVADYIEFLRQNLTF